MEEYRDLAEWALATLRSDGDVCSLVVGGASGVVESGEVDPKALELAQRTRRESETGGVVSSQVLAVFVMDTGEQSGNGTWRGSCSVYVCDRGGYGRIRTARDTVLSALRGRPANLSRNRHVVMVQNPARRGHEKFTEYNLDYERIDFVGTLQSYGSFED